MAENLFSEFPPVSSKQWKQQIQFELKGADYSDVVWESLEGIKIRPFYHGDEQYAPLEIPHKTPGFSICQDIFVFDVEKSIYRAKDSLKRGAESIRFTIADESVDIARIIGALPSETDLYFRLQFLSSDYILNADKASSGRSGTVFLLCDPIHELAKEGNWFSKEDNFAVLSKAAQQAKHIRLLSVDATLYQNAGANIVQQIAYALSHANEYLSRVENTSSPITIEVAIGSNYFFEIAKIRALRLLYALVANEYGREGNCHVIATPTKRNKTLYDYNVNMLRSTTECMSAVLGGADAVSNLPYDAIYHKSNEFGERISRNQLLILKHESYFDKVGNPADGSYYIESLTRQIAEKSLALFKEIESEGGILSQLKAGTIQRKITESAKREQELFDSGKLVLLGTNRHPDKSNRMLDDLELFPFVKSKPRKTLITPIIEKRLAEKLEQERLAEEKKERS
ncbi:MAG: methylmalonyl-CoA mutase [Flavobacterium sp.]|nr:MAG: methylmalonyl-CoA mutase [Flavobacterium sp.]